MIAGMSANTYSHSQLTGRIIGGFYDVYNELGAGFREIVYERAVEIALGELGLAVERQASAPDGRPPSELRPETRGGPAYPQSLTSTETKKPVRSHDPTGMICVNLFDLRNLRLNGPRRT
jgi:hypothetical protein